MRRGTAAPDRRPRGAARSRRSRRTRCSRARSTRPQRAAPNVPAISTPERAADRRRNGGRDMAGSTDEWCGRTETGSLPEAAYQRGGDRARRRELRGPIGLGVRRGRSSREHPALPAACDGVGGVKAGVPSAPPFPVGRRAPYLPGCAERERDLPSCSPQQPQPQHDTCREHSPHTGHQDQCRRRQKPHPVDADLASSFVAALLTRQAARHVLPEREEQEGCNAQDHRQSAHVERPTACDAHAPIMTHASGGALAPAARGTALAPRGANGPPRWHERRRWASPLAKGRPGRHGWS